MRTEMQILADKLESHRFELDMSVRELQQTNQSLKEREEYLCNMIEHASEGIMTVNHLGLIISANTVVCNLLGYDNSSLLGKPLNLFLNSSIETDFHRFLAQENDTELHFKAETLLNHKLNKDTVPVQLSISALKNSSKKKFLVILTDLSQIKKIQKDLDHEKAEKEALLKINEELDQFVYRVSHDLRAPLASSIGLIELAKNEPDKDKITEYLELQKKNLLRLEDFIGNILSFSRNTRNEVVRNKISFQDIIHDLMEQYSFSKKASKIIFNTSICQSSEFVSDQMRLKIILSNLISNAIKYSDPTKDENIINLEISVDKNFGEIKISDNGIGIQEEYHEKIFQPFFRATDYNTGSGVGLALVKEAVNKILGNILVNSEHRKGTTFTIHIPSLQ